MNQARAAFMAKDEEDNLNTLAYRVLLMLPSIYRLWGITRLAHLQPWIAEWAMPEMYSGVEGQCAEEAAYNTALLLEHCRLKDTDFTGGTTDIYKFLDQVQRPLLYELLEKAGTPKGISEAYKKFLDKLLVYNTVAGGVGKGYHEKASIPQGDPLSMMVTALLMRPWIMEMKAMAMNTRILVGDLQLVSICPRHVANFKDAFDNTHTHLTAMGAKIAASKSLTFSSDETTRKWLKTHCWRRVGATIPVITDTRDIGAHLHTLEGKKSGVTVAKRMLETASYVNRLNYIKA